MLAFEKSSPAHVANMPPESGEVARTSDTQQGEKAFFHIRKVILPPIFGMSNLRK